ncbi:hypothetical protein GALMADRAFT_254141 [Galerina marginata CBS 339.88]|uniref:G-protein coupled receptors family 1 profile domain-containing protein n=1 Tax=Galerina marginata (strain CBS 339.88) TaxID=685588 RepID=A0A067SUI9_GALM3|nr:hypothetical protein GALMADRAFT_254141 [Galerina marginata CBS 339.88]
MSVPAADPSLVSVEKLFLDNGLNSVVMFTFLMGIYTMVYFGTLSLYLTRKTSQRRMVIFSITLLYLLDVIMLAAQWYALDWIFLINGETRKSSFISLDTAPGWAQALSNLTACYLVVVADGLLIWRCYFVWNKSLRVIGLPCLLLLAEIALCLAETIIVGENALHAPTTARVREGVTIQSALFFTSLSSSLLATLLIAFRIHSVSKQNGGSKRRFRHIIEIVIQSAAVYSLALLILGVANAFSTFSPTIVVFESYGMLVAFIITGIAPTIMVARVCLAADTSTDVSTIHNLSGLQFQGQSTQRNATRIMLENPPEMNVEVVFTDKVAGIV